MRRFSFRWNFTTAYSKIFKSSLDLQNEWTNWSYPITIIDYYSRDYFTPNNTEIWRDSKVDPISISSQIHKGWVAWLGLLAGKGQMLLSGRIVIKLLKAAVHYTPLQKGTQVWFEFPSEIPIFQQYLMKMLSENWTSLIQKIFHQNLRW